MTALLEVEGLSLRFGPVTALDGVGFTVAAGERVALVGPNGAGKTSVLNCVSGVERPASGRVRFQGLDLAGAGPHRRARMGMARTLQGLAVVDDLDVWANLLLGGGRGRGVGRGGGWGSRGGGGLGGGWGGRGGGWGGRGGGWGGWGLGGGWGGLGGGRGGLGGGWGGGRGGDRGRDGPLGGGRDGDLGGGWGGLGGGRGGGFGGGWGGGALGGGLSGGGRGGALGLAGPLGAGPLGGGRDEGWDVAGALGLGARLGVRAGALGPGERKRLELGRALASGAPLLLLDEPFAGAGRDDVDLMCDAIRRSGAAAVLVDHDLDTVLGLADRVVRLEGGRVVSAPA